MPDHSDARARRRAHRRLDAPPTSTWLLPPLALVSLSAATVAQQPAPQGPVHAHIERTVEVSVSRPPQAVFSLLEPRGLSRWSGAWEIEYVWPTDGVGVVGAVCRKLLPVEVMADRHGIHHDEPVVQVWTLIEYEPDSRVRYAISIARIESWDVDIRLTAGPGGRTDLHITHRVTALDPAVNVEVEAFGAGLERSMAAWAAAMERALR